MTSVLAPKSLIITSFGATDRGFVREKNEDNFLLDDARGIYAVADGCGGIPHGERASLLTIQMIQNFYDEAVFRGDLFIEEMFDEINRAVFQEGHRLNEDLGMASTLTLAQIVNNLLVIGHVGDSVIYLYRAGALRQLTAEHTLKAAICATLTAEECENVPEALGHTLTRCIGHKTTVDVDVLEIPLQPGDRILLCTDGVTKYLDLEFVERTFSVAASPELLVHSLLAEAGKRGGMDNATGVAFFVKGNTPGIFGLSAAVKAK